MKILITGGSGFIGTNMINYLLKNNYEILSIDLEDPKIAKHKQFWGKVDIRDYIALESEVKEFKPDYIIHLAAKTDLLGKTLDDYDSNTLGTQNIIDIAKKYTNIKRVIFTSSMLVNKVGYSPKSLSDYNPDTVYGESKMEMEKSILNSDLKTEWTIIRPTSIWGPWFGEPYSNFFNLVLKGMFVHPGNRACTKTYGYVENSVYQIHKLLLANKNDVHKKIFYIGDKPAINISEWADEIKYQFNKNKNKKVPYFIFQILAIIGDALKMFNIKFPMTSFRLNNMTTDHIMKLNNLYAVVGEMPFSRLDGTKKTLNWIKKERK